MYGVWVSVCSSQRWEALGDSALFPTVRALQDHIAEGGSEVLVEECEDDRPHLRDCFYHRPLHRALCHGCHPLSNLGNPSHPALFLGGSLP